MNNKEIRSLQKEIDEKLVQYNLTKQMITNKELADSVHTTLMSCTSSHQVAEAMQPLINRSMAEIPPITDCINYMAKCRYDVLFNEALINKHKGDKDPNLNVDVIGLSDASDAYTKNYCILLNIAGKRLNIIVPKEHTETWKNIQDDQKVYLNFVYPGHYE